MSVRVAERGASRTEYLEVARKLAVDVSQITYAILGWITYTSLQNTEDAHGPYSNNRDHRMHKRSRRSGSWNDDLVPWPESEDIRSRRQRYARRHEGASVA